MIKKKRKRKTPTKANPNPWYDIYCKHKRRIFNRARFKHTRALKNNANNNDNNDILKNERKKAAKLYRKNVKKMQK